MTARVIGLSSLSLVALLSIAAPVIAPNDPSEQFRDFLYAPPMRIHLIDDDGGLRAPFVNRLELADQLARRYGEDRSRPRPLVWFSDGRLVQVTSPDEGPLLLLGADALGRDVFSRFLFGARASLSVALVAAIVALIAGTGVGAIAGVSGGAVDEVVMRIADFVLVLPAIYVVLSLAFRYTARVVANRRVRVDGRCVRGGRLAIRRARRSGDRDLRVGAGVHAGGPIRRRFAVTTRD